MTVVRLHQIGEKVLRAKARSVKAADKQKLPRLIRDLVDTMRDAGLIGIAAPQIGVSLRVFVTEIRKTRNRKSAADTDSLRVFVNPRVLKTSARRTVLMEGCGSVGPRDSRLFGPVRRPEKVTVEALDERMQPFQLEARGLLAKCVQHECDHLDGVVVLDKFTDTRKCWIKVK